jgi:hypothetical protein
VYFVTTVPAQESKLSGGFHAFRDELEVQRLG